MKAFEPMPGPGLGWLTHETRDGIDVSYFAQVGGEPKAFAESHFDRATFAITRAARLATPRAADARELRLLAARKTALAAPHLQCSRTLNTVILQDEGDSEIRVYLFSGWDDEKVFPMGGHSRFRLSEDGQQIRDSFQQTRSCLDMDAPQSMASLPFVGDAVDESPSAIQVFLNHQFKFPFLVLTGQNDRIWKIDRGLIHAVPEDDELALAIRKSQPARTPMGAAKADKSQ